MIKELLKFLANIYTRLRLSWWNLNVSPSRTVKLQVLVGKYIKFIRQGDIVRILYGDQHLVPFKKSFEYHTLDLYLKELSPGDVVIDVGANVGLFSLLGSPIIGENGKIYSFEPTPGTFNVLKNNIVLNSCNNIYPQRQALADRRMPIIITNPSPKQGLYKDALNRIKEVTKEDGLEDVIYTTTLDEFCKTTQLTRLDFIKVDIEGAELMFFKGAKETLSRFRPKIIFEANESHCSAYNYRVVDILVYLYNLDYDIRQLNEEQWFAQ